MYEQLEFDFYPSGKHKESLRQISDSQRLSEGYPITLEPLENPMVSDLRCVESLRTPTIREID